MVAQPAPPRYGEPRLVQSGLGQGSFRLLVTEAYGRQCAVTGERVLPEEYLRLRGQTIHLLRSLEALPNREFLAWHDEACFLG